MPTVTPTPTPTSESTPTSLPADAPAAATTTAGTAPSPVAPSPVARRPGPPLALLAEADRATLVITPWVDDVADPFGVHPCSRYVELYWLGILGPSTTFLLRRLAYGLDIHPDGFTLDLAETARALGLGDRPGANAPFRRSLRRLRAFGLARECGPGGLAVRTRIPPLPLRHLARLPGALQQSHARWQAEQRLAPAEQLRRRARRLAGGLAAAGRTRDEIEAQLGRWQFHPAIAYRAAEEACAVGARPS
ncbi:MAG: hypothetical protein M0Z62_10135 [Actinomycetota bacterium]|nr:hypothetical protein [Actinomycetota bacterium]